jgi:hypothetical protein
MDKVDTLAPAESIGGSFPSAAHLKYKSVMKQDFPKQTTTLPEKFAIISKI